MAEGTVTGTGPLGSIISAVFGGITDRDKPSAIDQVRGSPAWNDVGQLEELRNRAENAPGRRDDRARQQFIRAIDKRLDQIAPDTFEGVSDSGPAPVGELSPVFGGAGAFGAVFGMTEDARKAAERQIAKLKDQLKNSIEAKAGRAARAKKASTGAAIGTAKDLAKKAGKLAKRAGKGPPIRTGPTGVVIIGSQVLRELDEAVRNYQFGQMEDILKRQQAETDRVVKAARAAKVRAGRIVSQPEPQPSGDARAGAKPQRRSSRPKAQPSAVAGQVAQPASTTPAKIEPARPQPANPVPFATPKQMRIPVSQRVPKWVKDVAQLASIYRAVTAIGPTSSRGSATVPPILERSQALTRATSLAPGRLATETRQREENCYTVCRKPRAKGQKRKKPRICVSASKAQKLGLI